MIRIRCDLILRRKNLRLWLIRCPCKVNMKFAIFFDSPDDNLLGESSINISVVGQYAKDYVELLLSSSLEIMITSLTNSSEPHNHFLLWILGLFIAYILMWSGLNHVQSVVPFDFWIEAEFRLDRLQGAFCPQNNYFIAIVDPLNPHYV